MTPRRFVAIGECMVEMAPLAAGGPYAMGFAGDTMNTAWYLRRALPGASFAVDYLTAVGIDATSDAMLAFLRGAGLGIGHIARRDDRTVGLYLIQTDGTGERSFSYWRGQSAARTLAQDEGALDRALTGAEMAYLSGITLAILPEDDRARLLDRLAAFRAGGGAVVFDPNLRPALWPSGKAMCTAVMEAAAVATLALPSHEDEARWFGDTDPMATARRYAGAGVITTVVKNGPGEILAVSGPDVITFQPPPVGRVVDTTAAGDSFNAGFLATMLQGGPVVDGLRAGAALAAQVIGAPGALVALEPA